MKDLDALSLLGLAQDILKIVDHNIPAGELLKLVLKAGDMVNYELVTDRIPYDGLFSSEGEMLMPDWPTTLERLNETLYG